MDDETNQNTMYLLTWISLLLINFQYELMISFVFRIVNVIFNQN